MIDDLFPFYERELLFVGQLTQEFARRHPKAAERLGLQATGSSDPYVQRLLETFALIAGRTHAKIEDEFPELTDALLQFLYPHFLAPIPSMALVQFDLDPTRVQTPQGFRIDAGNALGAPSPEGVSCKFRTAYPVTLWPIRVQRAGFQAPPFPPHWQPPPGTVAACRLDLECAGELSFAQLQIDALRFFLHGDANVIPDLYEVLLNQALQVAFLADLGGGRRARVTLTPADCLAPVGFERAEGLLPYRDSALMGYRLLTEFFTYPAKFHFIDLKGFSSRLTAAEFGHNCEIVIFCGKTTRNLEQRVSADTFRLACTPVVNLFERTAEPISLRTRQQDYRIVAEPSFPRTVEVYAVNDVSSTDPVNNSTTRYAPFYSQVRSLGGKDNGLFWYTTRRRSLRENDRGTELYLSLVNGDFESAWPGDEALQVQITCTNRDLPLTLGSDNQPIAMNLELPAPIHGVTCLRPPSPSLRPPERTGGYWKLIAHLLPNPLSLQDGPAGRAALHDLLKLYDFSDPAAGQKHLADQAQQMIDGILGVQYSRVLGRLAADPPSQLPLGVEGTVRGGFCRGVEVTLDLDPAKFPTTGAFLFAAVMERFFCLYASSNSFTRMVARTPGSVLKTWPARAGEVPLL